MTTIPDNFNPTIPPRGTKEFREYAASVMRHYGPIAFNSRHYRSVPWEIAEDPIFNWSECDYAIIPQPKVTYRWYTREEFMRLVPTHGLFMLRKDGNVATAIFCVTGDIDIMAHGSMKNPTKSSFHEYEKSLDGGLTWEPVGVRVEL